MKIKRAMSLALVLSLSVSAAVGSSYASFAPFRVQEKQGGETAQTSQDALSSSQLLDTPSPDEDVRVIIVMDGDSVVSANHAAQYSTATVRQMDQIKATQDEVIDQIEETALDGQQLPVAYQYSYLVNGVAATVPYGKLEEIEAMDGVREVVLQSVYEPCSTQSDISYPTTISDGVMIGRENTWAKGYTGTGMKIAVIDTGLDEDHQNFAALPDSALTSTSMTKDTIAAVLPDLNVSYLSEGSVTVDDLYRSSKVTFGYNYVDNDLDITHDNDEQGDHGTHVAGIATANRVEGSDVVGVAPDAQLLVMKVFGKEGGAYTQDWLAALEDAMLMGVDVVNMSLGTSAGFTVEEELVNEVFNRVAETGTVLCVSAGNSYTSGYSNALGQNANLTSNPDNGILGSPGSYHNALSVASVDNVYNMSNYITVGDDHKLAYQDGNDGPNAPFNTLADTPLQVVAVPGVGSAEDFAQVDVEGKIALVQRGVNSFSEKHDNAQQAGAIGCLIYNNQTGSISINLSQSKATIPCATLTMEDGAYVLSALEADPNLTVTVGADQTLIASDTAYQMSDFSSWGVTPSLTLEPDITAPGGNIYSTTDDGTYGLMSGTSMASPNLAGISALVKQYVTAQEGLGYADGPQTNSLIRALMMSTATPLVFQQQDGVYYSPRKQGAGLANAYASITTQAYLSVDGCDVPKVELGDDAGKTGVYDYQFHVTNFGQTSLFYDLNTVAQTEGVTQADGYTFMSGTPKVLEAATAESTTAMVPKYDVDGSGACNSHDAYQVYLATVLGKAKDPNWSDVSFRYNTNGDETTDAADVQAYLNALVGLEDGADLNAQVMEVKAGATQTVQVSVTLADSDKTYFQDNYPNGCYVEGYTFLSALNTSGTNLSLPYLGFYGDWTDAPIFDGDNSNPETKGFYWGDSVDSFCSQYDSRLYTLVEGQTLWTPGMNPIDQSFDLSHVSVSPNGDGSCDNLSSVYLSLLRNAKTLSVEFRNAETGEVYYTNTVEHARKTSYLPQLGVCLPYIYPSISEYTFTDAQGNPLPNNTKVTLSFAATLDYPGAEPQYKSVDITVDTAAPQLLSAQASTGENGQRLLTLTFQDNLSVPAVLFADRQSEEILDGYIIQDAEATRDESGNLVWTQTYDVSDLGNEFIVSLKDYSFNGSDYTLDLSQDGDISIPPAA